MCKVVNIDNELMLVEQKLLMEDFNNLFLISEMKSMYRYNDCKKERIFNYYNVHGIKFLYDPEECEVRYRVSDELKGSRIEILKIPLEDFVFNMVNASMLCDCMRIYVNKLFPNIDNFNNQEIIERALELRSKSSNMVAQILFKGYIHTLLFKRNFTLLDLIQMDIVNISDSIESFTFN